MSRAVALKLRDPLARGHHVNPAAAALYNRGLPGSTDRRNRGNTAAKPRWWGTGSHFHRGSGGNGDRCLEISIDYRGKTAVTAVMGTISVAAIMGTKLRAPGGNGDDFWFPWNCIMYNRSCSTLTMYDILWLLPNIVKAYRIGSLLFNYYRRLNRKVFFFIFNFAPAQSH